MKKVQRVNVDFSIPLLRAIDRECARLHVTRQAWIKIQLAAAIDGKRLTLAEELAATRREPDNKAQS